MQFTFSAPGSLKERLDKSKPRFVSRSRYLRSLVETQLTIDAAEKIVSAKKTKTK